MTSFSYEEQVAMVGKLFEKTKIFITVGSFVIGFFSFLGISNLIDTLTALFLGIAVGGTVLVFLISITGISLQLEYVRIQLEEIKCQEIPAREEKS